MRAAPQPKVVQWVDRLPVVDLFVYAVTKAEIEVGIGLLPDGKRKEKPAAAAKAMFTDFAQRCLPFDDAAASAYARLVIERQRSGRPISVEDAQIAAIALVHGMIIATRNTDDFRGIAGLRVVNPWEQEPRV
jgi:predicted nucleic acid-binding protein